MLEKLPQRLLENLAPGECVVNNLKTFSIAQYPEYTLLTDRRIIYFDQKILGRYDLVDIPYTRLMEMDAKTGRLGLGNITLINENDEKIELTRVPNSNIPLFIESLEKAINHVAVEPISIRRSRGLIGKMTWNFKKTPEMIFKSRPDESGSLSSSESKTLFQDPLKALQMRFVKGEISKIEYEEMKKILE